MKIYADPMDQTLLCAGYDYLADCPMRREVVQSRMEPGIRQKKWWRYQHAYLGLEIHVAYIGPRAVGHIEFMPIEHAPRPIAGGHMAVITCLHVAPEYQGQGIGEALLRAAERAARVRFAGMAVIAQTGHAFLPVGFFLRMGYRMVDARGGLRLLHKPFEYAGVTPAFLPIRYRPRVGDGRIKVDLFHCPQCARSGWAVDRIRRELRAAGRQVDIQVFNASERQQVEAWGLDLAAYVDGEPIAWLPPSPTAVLEAVKDRTNVIAA